ncbi:RNA-directed DNA polymerase [Halomonas qinghailakensis]|uniref:RNA-directed DNA polymerase n=1 Tax=Halomonas qinghailakensis TaxID=2937790 RepID=A0AA46YP04_9GAMM|nr:antiviral reverse transcriptase Drt3a [Halomonas sp. ZZQ-149]UYO75024.1 RNA-directed DNA polymerase [Halomonas sp. ZZQ-149]
MFDQSFSHQNFFKIYSYENKRGNNLASRFFTDVSEEYAKIKRARKLIRKIYSRRRYYSKENFDKRVLVLYKLLREIKNRKNELVRNHLKGVSNNVSERKFKFTLTKSEKKVKGKDVFQTGRSVESFFAEKQIQKNIKYTYGVKQADRDLIVPQLRSVLDNKFPKVILKTDIKSFYETINRRLLLEKLNESPILSLTTRKLIARILKSYEEESGEALGIPRGVGVSAYLSELYMQDFDSEIESLPNMIYYARYVDDIIIVLSPEPGKSSQDYLSLIENILEKEKLSLNFLDQKTKNFDFSSADINFEFDYLGYKFKCYGGAVSLELANKKKSNYNRRIADVINAYKKNSIKQPSKARKELLLRLKFLTYNTKLSNNKGNAVVGIYNSNKWITNSNCLQSLDDRLNGLAGSINNQSLRDRISKFSFKKGFDKRLFANFSAQDFSSITRAWSK